MFHPHYVTLTNGRPALIRFVEPKDAEPLIDHVNDVGSEMVYIMTERLPITPEEERELLRKINRNLTLFLVATLEGKIVGSADIQRGRHAKNAHTASLGIAISKEARGLGLGKAMMDDLLRWARNEKVRKVTLRVFASNDRAISLYRSFGFEEEGRLKGEVILGGQPVDELLMALWL